MMRMLPTALITCLLSSLVMGGECELGNDRLTIMMGEDGHLAGMRNRDGDHRNPGFRKLGALFRVTLLENVYGLDAGKRRTVALKPVSQEGDHAQVPEFIVRVMPDFSRDVDSVRMKAPGESEEAKKFNDMLDKFQGASGVDIKDRPVKLLMPCDQQSSPISLRGGQKYYIEARHKDGGGGDNLAVAWAGPGITRAIIAGKHLSPFGSAAKGSILREWWTGIDGNTVNDLTSHASYPDRPAGNTDITFINRNRRSDPWLEIQFFVRDEGMPVGALE